LSDWPRHCIRRNAWALSELFAGLCCAIHLTLSDGHKE